VRPASRSLYSKDSSSRKSPRARSLSELSDSDDDDDDEDPPADPSASSQASDDDDDEPARQFTFPHLDAEIRAVLERYDGAVFPKLNWSSPQVPLFPLRPCCRSHGTSAESCTPLCSQDAAWMIPGQSLKCQNPADVYLLLKSSDFISHDLDHAFDGCVDFPPPAPPRPAAPTSAPAPELDDEALARLTISPSAPPADAHAPDPKARPYTFELVLKKWFDMPGSQQWRCFVRDNMLLGAPRSSLHMLPLEPRG